MSTTRVNPIGCFFAIGMRCACPRAATARHGCFAGALPGFLAARNLAGADPWVPDAWGRFEMLDGFKAVRAGDICPKCRFYTAAFPGD